MGGKKEFRRNGEEGGEQGVGVGEEEEEWKRRSEEEVMVVVGD